MDEIDRVILELLEKNCRMSFNEMAQILGKTEATVRRRVKKLSENGTIEKFTIEIKLNNKPKTYATIKIVPDLLYIKRIINQFREIEEVTDIWRLSGDCGLFLKVEMDSIEDINPLVEDKISQIEGVTIIDTCFITDIVK